MATLASSRVRAGLASMRLFIVTGFATHPGCDKGENVGPMSLVLRLFTPDTVNALEIAPMCPT